MKERIARIVSLVLTALFYGYAIIVDAPYRVVSGDYYVVTLVVLIALLDITALLLNKRLKETDKLVKAIKRNL